MSEQYEPSYYEIALTGRQVLVAFVILLICLVAAFFSGVWVGRGEIGLGGGPAVAERSGPDPADGAADSGRVEPEAPPQELVDEPEREELSFFEDGGGEADGAPAPGDGETVERPSRRPLRPANRPEAGSESAEGGEDWSAEPERIAGDGAQAEETAARPEAPRETVNPSGALTGGDVVIQVFSSADQAKAQEILERLHANDFRAFISPVTDGGETFYRVRVGPFEHQEDAERVAAELRRTLDLDTWITR